MKGKKTYILSVLAILIIGGISFYLSAGSEIGAVREALRSASGFYLALMALIMLFYYVTDGYTLRTISRQYKKDFTLKQGFVNGMVGTLFSDLTPSSSGGQFAQVFVFNKQGIVPATASGILLTCFISYQTVLISYTALIMIFQLTYFMGEGVHVATMALTGFLINFVVTGVLFFGTRSKKFQNFFINNIIFFLARIRIVKDYEVTSQNIRWKFEEFREESKRLQANKPLFIKICACNVIKQTCMYSMPFFAFRAIHVNVPWASFVNFLSLAAIINLINTFLPVPGASGGSEGCFMILFGSLGQANAAVAMLLWRFFAFYYGAIIGILTFMFAKDARRR